MIKICVQFTVWIQAGPTHFCPLQRHRCTGPPLSRRMSTYRQACFFWPHSQVIEGILQEFLEAVEVHNGAPLDGVPGDDFILFGGPSVRRLEEPSFETDSRSAPGIQDHAMCPLTSGLRVRSKWRVSAKSWSDEG